MVNWGQVFLIQDLLYQNMQRWICNNSIKYIVYVKNKQHLNCERKDFWHWGGDRSIYV